MPDSVLTLDAAAAPVFLPAGSFATAAQLDAKLDRIDDPANYIRAYTINKDGANAPMTIAQSVAGNSLVQRTGGNIQVPDTPTLENAAASKMYVDTKQDKLTAGENITITGGTISATSGTAAAGFPVTGTYASITNPAPGTLKLQGSGSDGYLDSVITLNETLRLQSQGAEIRFEDYNRLRLLDNGTGELSLLDGSVTLAGLNLSVSFGSDFTIRSDNLSSPRVRVITPSGTNQIAYLSDIAGGAGFPINGDGVSITNPGHGNLVIGTDMNAGNISISSEYNIASYALSGSNVMRAAGNAIIESNWGKIEMRAPEGGVNINAMNAPITLHSMLGVTLESEDIGTIRATLGDNGVRFTSLRYNRELFYFDNTGFYGWSATQNAWVLIFGTGLQP